MKSFLKKKTVIITAAAAAVLLSASLIYINLVISGLFQGNELKNLVLNFCSTNLRRAVTFENADISMLGNVRVTRFNLSAGSDFNDNRSLIKADEACFHLDFIKLLSGRIQINEITFTGTTLSLLKSYGKTYKENFRYFLELPEELQELEKVNQEKLTFRFVDSYITYTEYFKDDKISLVCRDANASFTRSGGSIKYDFSGYILPGTSSGEGYIEARGTLFENTGSSEHKIRTKNLNISCMELHLKDCLSRKISLSGTLSSTVSIKNREVFSVSGFASVADLHVTENGNRILNGDSIKLKIDASSDSENFTVKQAYLADENLELSLKMNRKDTGKQKTLFISFNTGKADITALSGYFTPFRDMSFTGCFSGNGEVFLDYKDDRNSTVTVSGMLRDFTVSADSPWDLAKGSMWIDLRDRKLKAESYFETNGSDFRTAVTSTVQNYIPLKTETDITVYSKKMNAAVPAELFKLGSDFVLKEAYADGETGYDEIFFFQKPVSVPVNNNTVKFHWAADKIFFSDRAFLTDFRTDLSLAKGVIKTDDFSLKGYNGTYFFNTQCMFDRDYPSVTVKAGVKGFRLADLSSDLNSSFSMSGVLSAECSYELRAYRIFHVIQNSIGNVSINIHSGSLAGTSVQKKISKWLSECGAETADTENTDFRSLDIHISHLADRFSIRTNFSGTKTDFSGYGSYYYKTGLNLPLNLTSFINGKQSRLNFNLTGKILEPVLELKKKGTEPLKLTEK